MSVRRERHLAIVPEIPPERFKEVRDLTIAGMIFETCLTEDLVDQVEIDTLQPALATAIETKVTQLVPNPAQRNSIVTGIQKSVEGADLKVDDYRSAKAVLFSLSGHDEELQKLELQPLYDSIGVREESALQKERQLAIRKGNKRLSRIKAGLIATDIFFALGVPGMAAGAVLPIYEAVQQTHLPVYADPDGRAQIIGELQQAQGDLTIVPAGLRKIQDKNNNTQYVPRPAILPRSDKAWYLVSKAGRDLNGAGSTYENPVLTVQGQIFSPSHQAIDSTFSGQRHMLGGVIHAIPRLATSHVASLNDQEFAREKVGIILGGTSLALTIFDLTQNIRLRNKRKRINGQLRELQG